MLHPTLGHIVSEISLSQYSFRQQNCCIKAIIAAVPIFSIFTVLLVRYCLINKIDIWTYNKKNWYFGFQGIFSYQQIQFAISSNSTNYFKADLNWFNSLLHTLFNETETVYEVYKFDETGTKVTQLHNNQTWHLCLTCAIRWCTSMLITLTVLEWMTSAQQEAR